VRSASYDALCFSRRTTYNVRRTAVPHLVFEDDLWTSRCCVMSRVGSEDGAGAGDQVEAPEGEASIVA